MHNAFERQVIPKALVGHPQLDAWRTSISMKMARRSTAARRGSVAHGDAVGAIGEARLGFKKENVGTHSIRSGAAMAMYLGECPVFMIMLIGRWSSDAFLRYIQKQVMEFSQNVAKKMLSCQNFRHIPDIHTRVPADDPCTQNNPNNAKTRRNVGGDSCCHVRLPPFSQFN
jgi:hypothetical protein